jgi:hypothetical protein
MRRARHAQEIWAELEEGEEKEGMGCNFRRQAFAVVKVVRKLILFSGEVTVIAIEECYRD